MSPLPWETVGNGIVDADGSFVLLVSCADRPAGNQDLAARIKNAVNSHAALVAAREHIGKAYACQCGPEWRKANGEIGSCHDPRCKAEVLEEFDWALDRARGGQS